MANEADTARDRMEMDMHRAEERTWTQDASVWDWLVRLTLVVFLAVIPLVWSSAVAAPAFTLKAAAAYPVGLLFILGVLLRSRRGDLRPDRLDWAVLAFVVVVGLATLLDGTPVASLFGPYKQGTGFGMFLLAGGLLVAGRRGRPEDVVIASNALVAGAVGLTLLMWLQQSQTGWAVAHLGIPSGRPGATLGSPVWSGAFVGAGFVAALVLFVCARRRWSPVYALAAGVCLSGLVIPLSRGAWLGTALAVVVAMVLAWPSRARLWRRFAALALVLLLAGSLMLVTRSATVPAAGAAGTVVSSELMSPQSDLGRLGIYRAALRAVVAKPLLGWGPGNFQLAWQHSADAAGMAPNLDSWGSDAHSLPLEVVATAGILGLLGLLAVVALFTAALVPIVRRQELSDAVPLLAAIALAVPLFLNPQSVYLTPLLFLLAGLAAPRSSVRDPSGAAEVSAAQGGDASPVPRDWIRLGLAGLVGVVLLVSMAIGVVALQADARLLRGLTRNDAAAIAAAADHFRVYPLAFFMAGGALAAAPETAPDAIAAYEKGLRLRPDDAYGLQSLAGAYMINSQPQEALSTADQALRAFPLSSMARFVKARALLALGQRDEALRLNREALTVTRPMAHSYYLAAVTFYMAGDTPTAKAVLEEGLTKYPGDASLRSALDQLR